MKTAGMKRREFIRRTGYGVVAAFLGGGALLGESGLAPDALANAAWWTQPLPRKFTATETVTLGNTGIKTSRLAMGTGTVGVGHHSHQTALGVAGLSALLLNGYEQGRRCFYAAEPSASPPHVSAVSTRGPPDTGPLLAKTLARRAREAAAAVDARIAAGEDPGLLAGVPSGIKDLVATKDILPVMGSPP